MLCHVCYPANRHIDDDALGSISTTLPSLSTLCLRNTEVTNSGLKYVRGLRVLNHLDLGSRFELNDEGLASLSGCGSLRHLAAGSFNLMSKAPRGFQSLESLSFGGGFANKGLHLLFPLPRLVSLNVQVCIDALTAVSVQGHVPAIRL